MFTRSSALSFPDLILYEKRQNYAKALGLEPMPVCPSQIFITSYQLGQHPFNTSDSLIVQIMNEPN